MTELEIPIGFAEGVEDYLDAWLSRLQALQLAEIVAEAGGPEHVAVFCVDLSNGFCRSGPLQSDRVAGIIPAIVNLFEGAYAAGIRKFVLPQDAHDPHAIEFTDFPMHCVRGTDESESVEELRELPFASLFTVIPKNCIGSGIGPGLGEWLSEHPEVTHRIVVGDCTDLCVYQLAMHLKLTANAVNEDRPVIIPSDCVETYDLSIETAREMAVPAHPGDFFHRVFLYHMSLNGIRVVRSVS
jgi:nicotinamidase-related amidase